MMWIPHINKLPGQPDHSTKFNRSWRGPYKVMQQRFGSDSDVYLLQDPATLRQWSMNVHKLAKYHPATFLHGGAILEPGPEGAVQDVGTGISNTELPRAVAASETGVPEERQELQLNDEPGLPDAQDLGLMTSSPPQQDGPTDGLSAGSTGKLLADENIIHSRLAETEQTTDATASSVEAIRQEQSAPSAKSPSNTVLEEPETRTRMTQQERRRQDQASQLLDKDYDELVISHDLQCILSHGYERRRIYYLVQWSNEAVPPSKIYREDFDTMGCLNDYWQRLPVGERPKEFRKLPFVPPQTQGHAFPSINNELPPQQKSKSRKRLKRKRKLLQEGLEIGRGESVRDPSG